MCGKLTKENIEAIKREFELKQNGANIHRVMREKGRVNQAWQRYEAKPTEERYAELLENIKIARAQVW